MRKTVSVLLALWMFCGVLLFPIEGHASGLEAGAIGSESAVLIDAASGQVLFQKNMNQKAYPASITKIMTGMLALEKGDLSQTVTMSEEAVFSIDRSSAHIALDVDEEITLEQALYALAIASANEAANGIAETVSGSVADFAKEMNQTAVEAGAQNTNFTNPNGLHDDNHYTTAYDMAKITAAALQNPKFAEIFGTEKYDIPPTNKQAETRSMWTRNKFINGAYAYDGILLSKTGWTEEAKYTLVTAAQRGDRTLVAVVMKAARDADIWQDSMTLFDYGFDEFTPASLSKEALAEFAPVEITGTGGAILKATFHAPEDISFLLPAGKTVEDVILTYEEAALDAERNQAQLVAHIRLAGEDTASSEFLGLDVVMSAPLEGQKDVGTGGLGKLPVNLGKLGLGLMLVLAIGSFSAFLLIQQRKKQRQRAKERRAREMRARQKQQAARSPYLSGRGPVSGNRYRNY